MHLIWNKPNEIQSALQVTEIQDPDLETDAYQNNQ